MSNTLRSLAFLALLFVFMAVPAGCAHVSAIEADVKSCVNQDAPDASKIVEKNAAPAIEEAFMCEAEGGFNPNEIPACLEEALATETAGLGQDAERFKMCVVTAVENDPNAKLVVKQRAHVMKMKLAARK